MESEKEIIDAEKQCVWIYFVHSFGGGLYAHLSSRRFLGVVHIVSSVLSEPVPRTTSDELR
jgi:hypothetical protein